MKTTALIPARLESKRFPNKLIKKINGTPIILKTYRAAVDSRLFENVYVVSGNDEILDIIKSEGGKTFKSLKDHNSGTDRIAEAAIKLNTDIVVNLQGDEPFISKNAIGSLIKSFDDENVEMASLMTKFKSFEEVKNPNNVKVIVDVNNNALYFSRLPIPYASKKLVNYNRHIGIYAFLKQSLIEFSNLKRLNLEILENLEGNRVVENSKKIKMVSTDFHGISIDTPEDLLKAKKFISLND
ncbi:3-deoxy-manno-octulosonate cytidylyltransferase [Flavobacteriaceae bacterium]|nr:3-deoxy-manno-octulosonate cytidylyltransferase [Flavobacteriaceae bacterium]